MKKETLVIKAFNKVYNILFLIVVLIGTLISIKLSKLDYVDVRKFLLIYNIVSYLFLIVYRTYLLFDKEYGMAYYGGPVNFYHELLIYPCNIVSLFYLIGVLTNNSILLTFCMVYSWGPIAALIFTGKGFEEYSLLKPRMIGYYFTHYMMLLNVPFMICGHYFIPSINYVPHALVIYALLSLIALVINLLLRKSKLDENANYFYNVDPDGNAILELFKKLIPYPYLFTFPLLIALTLISGLIIYIF